VSPPGRIATVSDQAVRGQLETFNSNAKKYPESSHSSTGMKLRCKAYMIGLPFIDEVIQ
jgi:hypothetical protein